MRTLALLLALTLSFPTLADSWTCKGRVKMYGKNRWVRFNLYVPVMPDFETSFAKIRGETYVHFDAIPFFYNAKAEYSHGHYTITTNNISHDPNVDHRWYFNISDNYLKQKMTIKLIEKCGDNTIMSNIGTVNCSL